jgi:hypothetical protein
VTATAGGSTLRIALSLYVEDDVLDFTIIGNNLSNELIGGDGDDIIRGEANNDAITGGGGNDNLTGGAGSDRFIFGTTSIKNGSDVITDFTEGVGGDQLQFQFGLAEELTQGQLRGTGLNFEELTMGDAVGGNTGFLIIDDTNFTEINLAKAVEIANSMTGLLDGDIFYMAFDNGSDAAIYQVTDTVGGGFSATSSNVQLLATFAGVNVNELTSENFINFSPILG